MEMRTLSCLYTVGGLIISMIFLPLLVQAGYTEFRMGEPAVVINDDEQTKVTIKGNSILVPAKIVHRGDVVDIQLLLDTGATKTMINADIADKLSIILDNERKVKVQVIGGSMIDAHLIKINRLQVGPHTRRDIDVFVVPHKGPAVEYDGLLGMDVLRGLKYRIDFKRKIIVWE